MIRSASKFTPPPSRRCHDCGKPTNDYRCEACHKKWMEKHHVSTYAWEGASDEPYAVRYKR